MKRWWNSPQQRPVAGTRRRACRVLAPAMMAGAVCLALPRLTLGQCTDSRAATSDAQLVVRETCFPRLPRTGGAVIEAWAIGILSSATQPDSGEACDLDHVCALAISSAGGAGTGMGTTIKASFETTSQGEPSPNLPFALTETIDYPHPVTRAANGNSGQGACYPANGVMAIAVDASSTLVLDIVGQACQVGSNTTQLVFTGSYVADAASTGTVANADGIGSVNINNPSGLSGAGTNTPAAAPWMKASLVGQLIYGN
jgi:hypothetical protein